MTKNCLTLICCLFAAPAFSYSQNFIESYYDQDWKEVVGAIDARFYSYAELKDSGWYRRDYYINLKKIQMTGLFEDKQTKIKSGTFCYFYSNGKIKSTGKYSHDKKEGLWLSFYSNGILEDSSNYTNGNKIGVCLSWYRDGLEKDSLNMDASGDGVYVSWFDNGLPSAAGRFTAFTKEHGHWQYFHKNGNKSADEIYHAGVLKEARYFNEEGTEISAALPEQRPYFPGKPKAWSQYVSKRLYFPNQYTFSNGHFASVVVSYTINEDGQLINAEVTVPFHPEFDKVALEAVKDCPAWVPAVSHNRKVCFTFSDTIWFSQGFD